MFRILNLLLTISAILACPFNCGGQIGGSVGEGSVIIESRGCLCPRCKGLRVRKSGPGAETRHAPIENRSSLPDDGCGNCLCQGATLTENDVQLDLTTNGFESGIVLVSGSSVASGADLVCTIDPHLKCHPAGFLLRLKLHSLLI